MMMTFDTILNDKPEAEISENDLDSAEIERRTFELQRNIDNHHFSPFATEFKSSVQLRDELEIEAIPELTKLAGLHMQVCTEVEAFDTRLPVFMLQKQSEYDYKCLHPEIIRVICHGESHYKSVIQNQIPDGYKIAEHRGHVNATSTLILIPVGASLTDYANGEDSVKAAKFEADTLRKRLISRRNKAAVELAEYKKQVKERLNAIPSLEKLLK